MTDIKIAMPGENVIHGEVVIRLRVSLIILPHSAVGGFAPRPRKLSAASSIIIVPISSMAVTREIYDGTTTDYQAALDGWQTLLSTDVAA